MSDIKIFVSNRIDLNSELISNPLFIPVRCGAVFDSRPETTILGDNSGENISERRKTFNELTVQYWAWKNVDADYYGLCHYRRYMIFSKKELQADPYTRITEYKKLPVQDRPGTSYAVEYPLPYREGEKLEPYYPVLTTESQKQFARYKTLSDKIPNLICCGRLADFKYYNMDQALERAMAIAEERLI